MGVGLSGVGLAGCGRSGTTITLVTYAEARPVFDQIVPEFERHWQAKTGETVTVRVSYGPPGAQTRTIVNEGFVADVLAQTVETHVTPLVDAGLVAEDWTTRLPHNAAPASTVMALVVRADDPNAPANWADLARPGLELLAINPGSADGRWGVLAGAGPVLAQGGDAAAQTYLAGLADNVIRLETGDPEVTEAFFDQGEGDAFVTFEYRAMATVPQRGDGVRYVVPRDNMRVDFPVTVVDAVVDRRGTRAEAEAFVDYLFSPTAQEIYAEAGYRPADGAIAAAQGDRFAPVETLYTVADLGGWDAVKQYLFADGALFEQTQP